MAGEHSYFPELWELLKKWLCMVDEGEFEATWLKIRGITLPKFIEYLEDYWMSPDIKFMWSGIFHRAATSLTHAILTCSLKCMLLYSHVCLIC
jgi:hypothetical protein